MIIFDLFIPTFAILVPTTDGKPFYSRFFPAQHILLPMTIFGFSCVFMYFTDRTSLYLKIQKQFDFWQFTIAMLLALALGLGTLKKPEKDLGFLNRDQTDEVSLNFLKNLVVSVTLLTWGLLPLSVPLPT